MLSGGRMSGVNQSLLSGMGTGRLLHGSRSTRFNNGKSHIVQRGSGMFPVLFPYKAKGPVTQRYKPLIC